MIYFNDRPVSPAKALTLAGLLKRAGCEPSRTVVTVDGRFVPPADYKNFVVPDGARVKAAQLPNGG